MRKMMWATVLIVLSLLPTPAYAKDFEVSLQLFYDRGTHNTVYYAPPNNTVKVRSNGPVNPLKVVVKNISSSNKRLYIDTASGGRDQITFEITDDRGNSNVVTKKPEAQRSMAQGYTYIMPGQTKEFELLLTEREWNNAYKLAKLGAATFKARVSYKNGSDIYYSDYYTIVYEG